MAVRKILAREFTWEVETTTPGTWVPIGGLTTFSRDPGKTDADVTDMDDDGDAAHMVAERTASYTLEGYFVEDPADGSRDAGQARVEVIGEAVGASSVGNFRYTTPGSTVVTFAASVVVTGPSGGRNDATTWRAQLTRSGGETVT